MEVARGGWRHPGNEARWGRTRFLRVFASGPVAYWQFSALHALLTAVPSPSHQLPAVLCVGPGAAGLLAQLPPDTRSCGSAGSLCLSQDGGARLACPSPARLLTLASSGAGSQLSLMSHGSGSSHKCPHIPPAWWGPGQDGGGGALPAWGKAIRRLLSSLDGPRRQSPKDHSQNSAQFTHGHLITCFVSLQNQIIHIYQPEA